MTKTWKRLVALVGAVVVAGTLSGCGSDSLNKEYLEGSNKGYIAGDFRVQEFDPDERGASISFAGMTEDGSALSSEDLRGKVVVVNFWYATCGPCRAEAPDLEAVWNKYQDEGVSFVGVNTSDQPATAVAFAENYGITYPSLMDADKGDVKLAFAQVVPPQSTPTTVVLDREGRVAARIIAQIKSRSILDAVVSKVVKES